MAEGCSGGWSTVVGYYLENAYLVKENCAPYESGQGGGTMPSCSLF